MSSQEIAWRMNSKLRDVVDRLRLAAGLWPPFQSAQYDLNRAFTCGPTGVSGEEYPEQWRVDLLARADHICAGRLTYFDLKNAFHGSPVNWNMDHSIGLQSPLTFASAIDYRDVRKAGDCKLVWEPNRHHQLVVLARAYTVSRDGRYARAVVEQMESWLDACPFGRGMNWRSPLELGIRLINWVWALALIRDSGLFSGRFRDRVLHSIYLHVWEITRKYSRYSSANNHLIGEAAGVYAATSYFSSMPNAAKWGAEARDILCRELLAQTFSDGCTREQALGYEIFVLQFYLVAGSIARATGDELPEEIWARLEKMLEFVSVLAQGGPLPLFGDCDDGYVLDLGSGPCNYVDVLAIGASLFGRPDLCSNLNPQAEALLWLPVTLNSHAPDGSLSSKLKSRAFLESGYYLLQSGAGEERISVMFDCGELGFGTIAAHGHADALSITLRAFGEDILVDPGTYDYFSYPEWRRYFRGSSAHNTVVVDSVDQSEMTGLFLWGKRANARSIEFRPSSNGGMVCGEHDGYCRLGDPCVHRRTVRLDEGVLSIQDEIKGAGIHNVEVFFHLAENCAFIRSGDTGIEILAKGGTVLLRMDSRLAIEILHESEEPAGGWVSRSYHSKVPSATIVGRATTTADTTFHCEMKAVSNSKAVNAIAGNSAGELS
jgi:hypothetical protein